MLTLLKIASQCLRPQIISSTPALPVPAARHHINHQVACYSRYRFHLDPGPTLPCTSSLASFQEATPLSSPFVQVGPLHRSALHLKPPTFSSLTSSVSMGSRWTECPTGVHNSSRKSGSSSAKASLSSGYHPQSKGQTEHINLEAALRCVCRPPLVSICPGWSTRTTLSSH